MAFARTADMICVDQRIGVLSVDRRLRQHAPHNAGDERMSDKPHQPESDGQTADLSGHASSSANERDAPKTCIRCGYILDHLPADRCPECGQEYDRYDLSTYYGGPFPREERFPRSTWITFLAAALMLLLITGACWLFFFMMKYTLQRGGP